MNALAFRPIDEPGPALAAAHAEPAFASILSLVASSYGISEAEVRTGEDEIAVGARDEFLWLADQLKAVSALASASYLGMSASDVWGSIANVERQRGADPALRNRLEEACLTLHCEAAALVRLGHPVRDASRPVDIARRIMVSRRAAGMASIEDVQSLAGGYLALHASHDVEALRQELDGTRLHLTTAFGDIAVLQGALEKAQAEARQARAALAGLPSPVTAETRTILLGVSFEPEFREFVLAAAEVDRASGPYERTARRRFDKACQALALAGEKYFNIKRTFK